MPGPPNYPRRTVLVFVDDYDLAAIAALRYARSLHPTALRAVHVVLDPQHADHLRQQWLRVGPGVPLDLVDCPDRRIERAAGELAAREASQPGTYVTVVLPRRSTPAWMGRLLHDRTAEKIARLVSRIPRSAATIIPFDVSAKIEVLHHREAGPQPAAGVEDSVVHDDYSDGAGPAAARSPASRRRGTVAGCVRSLEIRPVEQSSILACTIAGTDGDVTALFYGRSRIPGLRPGSHVRLHGTISVSKGRMVLINPAYELLD